MRLASDAVASFQEGAIVGWQVGCLVTLCARRTPVVAKTNDAIVQSSKT